MPCCKYWPVEEKQAYVDSTHLNNSFKGDLTHTVSPNLMLILSTYRQGSQNFKIPGSPSGRYSSDFGSPKLI